MLVANKADLSDRRQVSVEEGERKARDCSVLFGECSAKDGHDIAPLFRTISLALVGLENGTASSGAGGAVLQQSFAAQPRETTEMNDPSAQQQREATMRVGGCLH